MRHDREYRFEHHSRYARGYGQARAEECEDDLVLQYQEVVTSRD